ncbi:MAG: tetratricopeptide repeat protein [Planctomycetota bacterium]
MRALALLTLACSLAALGCESAPVAGEGVAPVASQAAVSPSLALALALSLEPEAGGALPDGVIPRRVAALAQALAEAGATKLSSVTVLAGHVPLARALPRGHLQVSRGLVAALAVSDPRQPLLAGALAHEVARVALGQPRTELWASLRARGVARLTSSVAVIARGEAEGAPDLGWALALVREPPLDLDARAAADRLAVRLLARAGYAPAALPDAYARLAELEARDPALLAPWARAHGAPAAREREGLAAVEALGRPPAGRDPGVDLDLARLVAADRDQAVLVAAAAQAREGRVAAVEAQHHGEVAQRVEAGWLGLLARERRDGAPATLERDLRRLLVRAPEHYPARLRLTELYLELDRGDAAKEELERLIARRPLRAELQLLLARLGADEPARRRRLALARDLEVPPGRVAEAARRALEGEPRRPQRPPNERAGGRRFLSGG